MKIIECPRDAMQGIAEFIPTADKIRYINQLLKVGFDTVDAGSFVSAKAIPQMRDSAEVMEKIETGSASKILVIVANTRGAVEACRHPVVNYIGFPMSISETFQKRNTNQSISTALNTLNEIQDLCIKHSKDLVAYLSMGFGNPYGDPYNEEIVAHFADILVTLKIKIISLADTIGAAQTSQVTQLFQSLSRGFPAVEFGAHLHVQPVHAAERIQAALDAGCKRFDGAIKGYGGCPMAEDELVGNLATETLVSYLDSIRQPPAINRIEFANALRMADEIFPHA